MKRFHFLCLAIVAAIVVPCFAQQEDDRRERRDPYERLFSIRGVELSEEQQKKIAELRKQHVPKLDEQQQQRGSIETAQQRRARREAFQAAREAGKDPREARQAAEEAVELTAEQKEELAKLQKDRRELIGKIQSELRALLTPQQREQIAGARRRAAGRNPTHANVKYGPADRNVMDVWLAESDKPTPVLVSIHGGGFRGGNKRISPQLLSQCLEAGISAVAITYRLSDEAIAPAQMMDSARAIQFIRHNAKKWNIDPERIAATGGSAGAGISLWLGFHDDLADPDHEDPVLRHSTRLTCMYVSGGQTSYDPRVIKKMFPDANVYRHPALAQLYDVDMRNLDDLPKEKYQLFEKVSPINHLTKDDAPAILTYGMPMDAKPDIHHPLFGKTLKEKMDELGIRCEVYTPREALGGGQRLSIIEFIKQEFGTES